MRLPFLHKTVVKKITGDASGAERQAAEAMLNTLLRDLPELIAAAVVDTRATKTLAAYTATAGFDPYKISGRNAELVRQLQQLLREPWMTGQQVADVLILLDDQLHCIRPTATGHWFCYLAVRLADTNMAIAREVLRRAVS